MADLRSLPKVDTLAREEALREFPLAIRTEAARAAIDELRKRALEGGEIGGAAELAIRHARDLTRSRITRVINASGVILHTGAGRARLAAEAVEAIAAVAANHASVEIDLESGNRGDRQQAVRGLLCDLTGAEDALVVNNCAAAVLLTLTALCSDREVILSRGQMVEIGGSFRMPDVIRQSGSYLVEVGCTNKTHLSDYAEAVAEFTAAILRCHPSNYKVVGFTEEPPLGELVQLARERSLMLIDDVGSGCLVDTTQYGLPKEPTIMDSLEAGADVVTCSGDKLLGGPQAGIILGKKELVKKIKSHPMARAVRIDKLTLAGLEATLKLYRYGRSDRIPTIAYMAKDTEAVRADAEILASSFAGGAAVVESLTEVGGGSVPGSGIRTFCAVLTAPSANDLARKLRQSDPPVLARVKDDKVWLDPRTLEEQEVRELAAILKGL